MVPKACKKLGFDMVHGSFFQCLGTFGWPEGGMTVDHCHEEMCPVDKGIDGGRLILVWHLASYFQIFNVSLLQGSKNTNCGGLKREYSIAPHSAVGFSSKSVVRFHSFGG